MAAKYRVAFLRSNYSWREDITVFSFIAVDFWRTYSTNLKHSPQQLHWQQTSQIQGTTVNRKHFAASVNDTLPTFQGTKPTSHQRPWRPGGPDQWWCWRWRQHPPKKERNCAICQIYSRKGEIEGERWTLNVWTYQCRTNGAIVAKMCNWWWSARQDWDQRDWKAVR